MSAWPFRRRAQATYLDADDAYTRWAPAYPPWAHNELMEAEERAMRELLPDVKGKVALDAGCGTGRYLRLCAERGARRAIGVDRSQAMLQRAQPRPYPVILADIRELPMASRSIDVVIGGLVFMDVPELAPAIREVARVLKPGGVLVYSVLHPAGSARGWTRTCETARGPMVVRAWWHSLEDQRRACEDAGFEVETVREPCLDRDAGGTIGPVALVVRARRMS
jgi:malonyl-CoA O-methyltransferase